MSIRSNLNIYLEQNKSRIQCCGIQNPHIKFIKNLNNNTRSNPKQEIVLEGIFQQKLAIENDLVISCVFFCPELISTEETFSILKTLMNRTSNVFSVSEKVLGTIAEVENSFGIISVAQIPKYDLSAFAPPQDSTVVVLDGVEIPGNLGTILRTCDGAGVSAVMLTNKKTRITHPKCVRSSLGAVFCLPVFDFNSTTDCIEYLQANGYKIILADTRANINYFDYDYSVL